ncbi:MAG TPA: phosphodiester glycosidase family protein [Opitutales bacterium]|nr:phosphodiester glycosidase family protein [Opitutales bacterium]
MRAILPDRNFLFPFKSFGQTVFSACCLLVSATFLVAEPLLLHQQVERQPVTEGVERIHLRKFDERGWLNIHWLEIDLTTPGLKIDALLGKNQVTGAQPFSKTANERGAVAGINGDFFHIGVSNAPLGGHIQSGELLKSPPPSLALSVGFFPPNLTPFIGDITFKGKITSSKGDSFDLSEWNHPGAVADGIIFYDRHWGETAPGRGPIVHAILDENHKVIRLLKGKPGPQIPEKSAILLGHGRGASWLLTNAQPGDQLTIDYEIGPEPFFAAIGGHPLLVRDDEIVVEQIPDDLHPRSAIGFNRDKTRSWWVVVDGRSTLSRGMTHYEIAKFVQGLGATDVLNLDGGGSSTFLARNPGEALATVQNITSDGNERNIPNGLGLFAPPSSGIMKNLLIESPAPADSHLIQPSELRLAPGGGFQLKLLATDEQLQPVDLPSNVEWRVDPPNLGTISDQFFTAAEPGFGKIIASAPSSSGEEITTSQPLRVIGEPVELRIEPREVSGRTGETIALSVHAVDLRGFSARLRPEEIRWEILGDVGEIDGSLFHTGTRSGSGVLLAHFQSLTAAAPIGIGSRPELLARFEKVDEWRTTAVPEQTTSKLAAVADPAGAADSGSVLKLSYDFTGTSRTRAAYLSSKSGNIDLPGRPLQFGLKVFGDGNGAWLRGQIIDASGTARAIDFAREIDWTGWRYVEAEIPPGTSYPISLRRIYVVEPRTDTLYSGEIYLERLESVYAPEIDADLLPEIPPVHDPANRHHLLNKSDAEHFRFIVFGDSKVDPSEPNSDGVTVFSGLIDRINRHDVEFVIYTGDLIENDTVANFEFGKSFLERIRHPWHMTIANHEIAGTDSFDNYRKFFGETYYHFQHGNSEFLVLNASRSGGLRDSEPEQWPWLLDRLERSDAKNLFITIHIPVVDPMPGGQTGWLDKGEVTIFQDLLTKYTEKFDNIYVFNGHVHGFDRRPFDGVEYITTAGGGSPLYMQPDQGGFFHYMIVTVDGRDISYQAIPLLDRIDLPAEIAAKIGEKVQVDAVGVAPDEIVKFPLRYPAATEWKIADESIATFDPKTNLLHARKLGETTLTVHSDETSATARVIVTD